MPRAKLWAEKWTIGFCYMLPALFFLLVWFPEVSHYYVPSETITPEMLQTGRQLPADAVLEELRNHRFLRQQWSDEKYLIAAAEKLLRGQVDLPGYPPMTIHVPFDPQDINRGPSGWQLDEAALLVPQIFLDAYQLTGREEFFRAARDVILGWADYEHRVWLPRGFLWNDHAIAARVTVLTDFWRIYRHRADYQPEIARAIWLFAARSGELLAKPSHFTFATNHGLMQNLALWHLCLGFPTLRNAEQYKQLALERLRDQMGFYLAPEGVVLEHSAFYHEFGLELVGMAMRNASLLNLATPEDWIGKYEAAKRFYAETRRPDGSLPTFGDTEEGVDLEGPLVTQIDDQGRAGPLRAYRSWAPSEEFRTFPAAGYAIAWEGLEHWPDPEKLSQTVLTWSNHTGHGHKHADELSVLLWARGQTWWTNIGYWPYDTETREQAVCWAGSSAPHLVGEDCQSIRTAQLISSGRYRDLKAVEMQRSGPGAYVARRLVICLGPRLWIVVDDTSGDQQSRTTTSWTSTPNVQLRAGGLTGHYTLEIGGGKPRLTAFFIGPPAMSIHHFRGSRKPFEGWGLVGKVPQPASALVTEQPAQNSWAITVWALGEANSPTGPFTESPQVLQWGGQKNWRLMLPFMAGTQEISREGDMLRVRGAGQTSELKSVALDPSPNVTQQSRLLRERFEAAAKKYPRFRDLYLYRWRATYLLLALLLFQELFVALYRRMQGKHSLGLRTLNLLGWLCAGAWLFFFYLRAG